MKILSVAMALALLLSPNATLGGLIETTEKREHDLVRRVEDLVLKFLPFYPNTAKVLKENRSLLEKAEILEPVKNEIESQRYQTDAISGQKLLTEDEGMDGKDPYEVIVEKGRRGTRNLRQGSRGEEHQLLEGDGSTESRKRTILEDLLMTEALAAMRFAMDYEEVSVESEERMGTISRSAARVQSLGMEAVAKIRDEITTGDSTALTTTVAKAATNFMGEADLVGRTIRGGNNRKV